MRYLFLICFLGLHYFSAIAAKSQTTTDSLLNQLEKIISEREMYLGEKENRLSELKESLFGARSDIDRFNILGTLFDEYHSFNTDSAYTISLHQEALANKIGDKNLIYNAWLNKANILGATGMYHESLVLIDSVNSKELPDYLKAYYFHTKRTVYGNLADYAVFKPEKDYYEQLTDDYRDSLLVAIPPNSMFHILIKADQLNVHGHPEEAIGLLEDYIKDHELSEHDKAIFAWSLSESYGIIHDTANQKKQLLISAISDMKSSVREYVSLRQLALLLYKEGDLDRAYKFMTIAVDDAAKCNARQRIVELSSSYPMINGIYVETVHHQKKALERTIIIITLLTIILIALLLYMRKQMVRIAEGRKNVEEANNKLNDPKNQIRYGQMSNGDYVIGLFNRTDQASSFRINFSELGITGEWNVRDLWEHTDEGTQSGLSANILAHGCKIVKLSK